MRNKIFTGPHSQAGNLLFPLGLIMIFGFAVLLLFGPSVTDEQTEQPAPVAEPQTPATLAEAVQALQARVQTLEVENERLFISEWRYRLKATGALSCIGSDANVRPDSLFEGLTIGLEGDKRILTFSYLYRDSVTGRLKEYQQVLAEYSFSQTREVIDEYSRQCDLITGNAS